MEINKLKAIVEGLLFASGNEGITVKQLSDVLEVTEATVELVLDELKQEYENTDRGIRIMQAHEVFHLTTRPEHSSYYKKLLETPQATRMSQAALETLAIIAYNQPITRTEIEEIRGVKSDRPVQTLLSRLLIEEVGRKDTVGKPILFATSKEFLTYFGLTSLDDLPPLPDTNDEELESEADLFFERFNEQLSEDPL
ncbi:MULTISPECIES: SMC-Scp complex subunit ScpB [Virgibacillus]|uniref:Segregation and condensation protein B n=1 Tax=Virgibacillus pantothenticus TaxID=1473 RepID=A0A0L0QP59_VIRPA|nr:MULTISPECIES: SMC-Scp complex subunit ScpB [Virgibacillus]API90448.1 SMC-Scp complex subunit ScpB [Virgibacillus sp. 6R]KNE20410.1 segregation and condensation protein B [Virgibacillus pantothenticus]MBS7429554.1 SMC-Scp complex subunit ScpB [Virgibacillus sp. 19R1-5]MBU8565429.1 SMC-Scp complex subunit ScpB [Virgibacillus pantothenticus]MBU8599729.1 SMC-Scp complex subunit ScpB [Virgibacillus pantothenticus]